MAVSRNIRDFSDLICQCLSLGWEFAHGPPSEDQLQHWAALGRAERVFVKPPEQALEPTNRCLHLIRCKEEALVLAGHRRWKRVGLWTAWLDERHQVESMPQCGFDRV